MILGFGKNRREFHVCSTKTVKIAFEIGFLNQRLNHCSIRIASSLMFVSENIHLGFGRDSNYISLVTDWNILSTIWEGK